MSTSIGKQMQILDILGNLDILKKEDIGHPGHPGAKKVENHWCKLITKLKTKWISTFWLSRKHNSTSIVRFSKEHLGADSS